MDANLDREAAHTLLRESNGRVKVAIVMRKLGVGREEAEQRLAATNGRLRDVLK